MADPLKFVDLFCGAGGLSLGFEQAGFEGLAATDGHDTAAETYESNLETTCVTSDIRDLTPDEFIKKGEFDPSEVDVLIGGPPCKGFSLAGSFDSEDPRNTLFKQYLEFVEEIRPDAILMENVTGILSMEDGRFRDRILDRTRDMGYNTEYIKLNAADYGTPQLRERVFFIGYQNGHSVERPKQTHSGDGQARVDQFEESDPLKDHVTTKEAVEDLAFLGIGEEAETHQREPMTEYQKEMRADSDELYNHKSSNHSQRIQERFDKFQSGDSVADVESRMGADKLKTQKHTIIRWDPDEPANTVTTLPEDCIHYKHNRIPTVREMARIQSFPDWFEFKGPRTTGGQRRAVSLPQYSQAGNAVPPKLAKALAEQMKLALREPEQVV